ncbi:MAG: alpha/beta fold hydrolase [Bryobacteraceae bacterium]
MIRTLSLPNGIEIPFIERGDDSGTPVIFLHGYSDSWRSFQLVLPYLPASIRAFALTQRGHGNAGRPVNGYRTRDFAADLAGFMDTAGLADAVIVGHSMGGLIAQRFALDYPDRVRGLVLAGTAASLRRFKEVQELWEDFISQLRDPIDRAFVSDFQRSTLARPVPRAYLKTVIRESLKAPARVWRSVMNDMLGEDPSYELRRIKAPTLMLWGERDTYCPQREREYLASAIAGSRSILYPGAGHALHWEEPERFAADIDTFASQFAGRHAASPMPPPDWTDTGVVTQWP